MGTNYRITFGLILTMNTQPIVHTACTHIDEYCIWEYVIVIVQACTGYKRSIDGHCSCQNVQSGICDDTPPQNE